MRLEAYSKMCYAMSMNDKQKARFWGKVNIPSPIATSCWIWTGTTLRDYGQFWLNNTTKRAHRVSYEEIIGPIPDGLELDHLCRNPLCVNPLHLEAVTTSENNLRGNSPALVSERNKKRHAERTHCAHGHELTFENTYLRKADGYVRRDCKECGRLKMRRRRAN